MGMKNCRDCGKQVSSRAKQCPSCGRPRRKSPFSSLLLWAFVVFFVLPIFVFVGKGGNEPGQPAVEVPPPASAPKPYEIVSDTARGSIKRTVEVRLNQRISEDRLRTVAREIYDSARRNYERTFIGYRLADQAEDSVYWATTHYNPALEVKILGLTESRHSEMSSRPSRPLAGEVIGVWLDERPYVGARKTLVSENGKLFMHTNYSDGSEDKSEMIDLQMQEGVRIEDAGGNSHGEYYFVNGQSELEYWGANGKFYTARPLPNDG